MEITLVFLAAIMFTLLGWLLKQSFNTQPWVAEVADEADYAAPMGANSKTIALVAFLAVATSLFSLLVSAYALRMELGDWLPLNEPDLLWANTGLLVVASIAFHWTRNAAVNGDSTSLKLGLMLTGLMTIGFVAGQLVAWQQLVATGQYITLNPANAFFYLMTGVHGIHMLGGLYVWARATVRVFSRGDAAGIEESVRLCTIYWHFLLLVWLILFGLLLST